MSKIRKKIQFSLLIILFPIILNSCKLGEFKLNEIKLKEDWKIEIYFPLFVGQFDFIDLIHNNKNIDFQENDSITVLKYTPDSTINIPTRLISEPTIIIRDFNFLIEGDDYLASADINYKITNSCPFPLHIQMRFFEKNESELVIANQPVVLPPAFAAGITTNDKTTPTTTNYDLPLSAEQLVSFKKSNRIEFTTWFDTADSERSLDTLSANYPVELSINLSGVVHRIYE